MKKDQEIRQIMTPVPASIGPETSVLEAHRLMHGQGIHHLPVVHDGVLVGMVSSADLVKALLARPGEREEQNLAARLRTCQASTIMSHDPVALPQTASLVDAVRALGSGAFHALPVVAPGNVLVGIVTSTDLIQALRQALESPVADAGGGAAPETALASGEPQRRALEGLYRATKQYLHSGRGEIEHGRLLVAFAAARESLEGSIQQL